MEWGKQAKTLEQQALRKGVPLPGPLQNKPYLFSDLQWIWNAFWSLSNQRQVGFSPNPIAISDAQAWLEFNEIEHDRAVFWTCIQEMDRVWLAWSAKQRELASKRRR